MKSPVFVVFVLAAIYLNLQLSQGKEDQDSTRSDFLERAREVVFTGDQQSKRQSSEPGFGSCTDREFDEFFLGYPRTCRTLFGEYIEAIDGLSFTESVPLRTAFFCNADCGQPWVNYWFGCGFEGTGEFYIAICGSNLNSDRCGDIYETIFGALIPAEDACLPRTRDCSTECQEALEAASDAAGCCVNIFNNTAIEEFVLGADLLIDEYRLWASCGVDTPGFCRSTLTRPPPHEPTDGSAEAIRVTGIIIGLTFFVLIAVMF